MEYKLKRFNLNYINNLVLSGQLGLPDFQREFVWTSTKVTNLLQSIAREWPVGSMLMMEGSNELAVKSFELGPEVYQDNIKFYLLDGQQRITSLYHALNDISDVVYFLDLNCLLENSLDDDFIFFSKRTTFNTKFPSMKEKALNGIIEFKTTYDLTMFNEWLSYVEDNEKKEFYASYRNKYLRGISNDSYDIPITILPGNITFTALSKIFEVMNVSPVRLSTSDLLVAATLPKGINLRDMWSNLTQLNPEVQSYGLDLIDVLRVCILLAISENKTDVKGLREADLIKVDPYIYQVYWDMACKQITNSISFSKDNLGVWNKSFLPSPTNLIALSIALKYKTDYKSIVLLWLRWIFEETFVQSSHTKLMSELNIIKFDNDFTLSVFIGKYEKIIDSLLQRPCGTYAYFFRGINSLRAMVLNKKIKDSKLLDYRKESNSYSTLTNTTPKKNEFISTTRIGFTTSQGDIKIYDLPNQEINNKNLKEIIFKIIKEDV